MRIAIVGGGISGLVTASLLHSEHEITLFETRNRIGGHTHTVDATDGVKSFPVDTGFIVYNEKTYPKFSSLLRKLSVTSHESRMSFSVRCESSGLEYSGTSLNTFFAQRRNVFRPSFLRMASEILRFNRESPKVLEQEREVDVGSFVREGRYSDAFVTYYLSPLGSSIWSCPKDRFLSFPMRFLVSFLLNHGMLSLKDRPVWRVLRGGSKSYLDPLVKSFANRVHLEEGVVRVKRCRDHVRLETTGGKVQRFDEVVFACHSDQALNALEDPSDLEKETLSAIPYQRNDVVLHTDTSVLPRSKRAWSSWNTLVPKEAGDPVQITYNMNILQNLDSQKTFCVTLNNTRNIASQSVLRRFVYDHPVFTFDTPRAQENHSKLIRRNRTSYCGAYWRYGFHEDGVLSALKVTSAFGVSSW